MRTYFIEETLDGSVTGFPWAFWLPSTAAAQGNQPMISELRAVTLVPGLEPNARNAGEKRLAAGGCSDVEHLFMDLYAFFGEMSNLLF